MKTISVSVSDEQTKYLNRLAHELSLKNDKNITKSELIRKAIEAKFPVPEEAVICE